MSIQTQLFTLLSTGSTGAGARVYPLTATDNAVTPYITYQRISTNSENVMSGSSGLANTRLQIDVYADTYLLANTVADQVDNLLNAWAVTNVSVSVQDLYEDAVKLYRVSMDFSIWHDW